MHLQKSLPFYDKFSFLSSFVFLKFYKNEALGNMICFAVNKT